MSKTLLFHVGYHKTATTWLQKRLFIEKNGFHQLANHDDVFRLIVRPHGLHFHPKPMRELIKERRSSLPQEIAPVISSEILSGNPFYAGQNSDVHAERIKEIEPNARILISIRNQFSILRSIYMQYLFRGGTMSLPDFLSGIDEPNYFGFDPKHFEYDHLVYHYQKLFGRENVLVITQEAIKADAANVSRKIASFSGNTWFERLHDEDKSVQSPSYPEYTTPILRRINKFQKSLLNPNPIVSLGQTPHGLFKVFGHTLRSKPFNYILSDIRPVSSYIQKHFKGRYAASNRRLEGLVAHKLDLSAYEK